MNGTVVWPDLEHMGQPGIPSLATSGPVLPPSNATPFLDVLDPCPAHSRLSDESPQGDEGFSLLARALCLLSYPPELAALRSFPDCRKQLLARKGLVFR